MQFEVWFFSRGGYPVQATPKIGNWHIEEVRKITGVKLPNDAFYPPREVIIWPDVMIFAPPSVVCACPHFATSNVVNVYVPHGGLNGFLFARAIVYYDRDSNQSLYRPSYVKFDYGLDTEAILEAWSKQNYPTRWTVTTSLNPYQMVTEKRVIELAEGDTLPGHGVSG